MSKTILGLSIYMGLLFLISFFVPINEDISTFINGTAILNNSVLGINGSEVSSTSWDIGDRFHLFISFFSFSVVNPLDAPAELLVIFSVFNLIIVVMLGYAILNLIRGGGGI